MSFLRLGLAAVTVAVACGTAAAGTIVDIDAQKWGCSQCSGPQNINPGTTVSPFFTGGAASLLQVTLAAGTYTLTNGDPNGTDYWSSWNFEGYPTSGNWVWSFVIANAATDVVLKDDYVGGVESTQLAMSDLTGTTTWNGQTPGTELSATTTAGFTDTLTLASTTTLDFFIDDYDLGDNGGGVALNITAVNGVPEPSSFILIGAALLAIGVKRANLMPRPARSGRSR